MISRPKQKPPTHQGGLPSSAQHPKPQGSEDSPGLGARRPSQRSKKNTAFVESPRPTSPITDVSTPPSIVLPSSSRSLVIAKSHATSSTCVCLWCSVGCESCHCGESLVASTSGAAALLHLSFHPRSTALSPGVQQMRHGPSTNSRPVRSPHCVVLASLPSLLPLPVSVPWPLPFALQMTWFHSSAAPTRRVRPVRVQLNRTNSDRLRSGHVFSVLQVGSTLLPRGRSSYKQLSDLQSKRPSLHQPRASCSGHELLLAACEYGGFGPDLPCCPPLSHGSSKRGSR